MQRNACTAHEKRAWGGEVRKHRAWKIHGAWERAISWAPKRKDRQKARRVIKNITWGIQGKHERPITKRDIMESAELHRASLLFTCRLFAKVDLFL